MFRQYFRSAVLGLTLGFGFLAVAWSFQTDPAKVESPEQKAAAVRVKLQFAEDELERANSELRAAQKTQEQSQEALRTATEELDIVVKRLERGMPESSPFGQARKGCLEARAAYGAAVERAVASPECQKVRENAASSGPKAVRAAEQAWYEKSPPVREAAQKLKLLEREYDAERTKLLTGSLLWKQTSEDLKKAEAEAAKADEALQTAKSKRIALNTILLGVMAELASPEGPKPPPAKDAPAPKP
jgi:hypothetical protein